MSLPLEEIKLRVRAVAAGVGESESDKKTPFVWVTGRVVEQEPHEGEQITAMLYFGPGSMDRSAESLIHFGFASDDIAILADADEAKCGELLPEVVEYACAPEEFEGKWRLKVKWVNRVSRGKFEAKKKLEGGELKALSAQMRSVMKNARGAGLATRKPANGTAGSPHPQQPHPNAPGQGRYPDDDIPFLSCDLSAEPSPIARVLR